jgi:hypothetical protein
MRNVPMHLRKLAVIDLNIITILAAEYAEDVLNLHSYIQGVLL